MNISKILRRCEGVKDMKIKYTSCDGVTEVEEEILQVEFYECRFKWGKHYEISCVRSPESPFYKKNPESKIENIFTVPFERVRYIRV